METWGMNVITMDYSQALHVLNNPIVCTDISTETWRLHAGKKEKISLIFYPNCVLVAKGPVAVVFFFFLWFSNIKATALSVAH